MIRRYQMAKLVKIVICTLLLVCAAYSFAQQQSTQATLHHRPPGTCPPAFPTCIFYGGDSDWNVIGGNISYLPNRYFIPLNDQVFDNATFTTSTVVTGMFANILVNPSDLPLYTQAILDIRVGLLNGNQGTLIASVVCVLGSNLTTTPNGQNVSPNLIGVWFDCKTGGIALLPGTTYWFSLSPSSVSATTSTFQWTTSVDPPAVGARQEFCDGYLVQPSCAYYDFGENTIDTAWNLPYPTAAGPSGAFSWGLY